MPNLQSPALKIPLEVLSSPTFLTNHHETLRIWFEEQYELRRDQPLKSCYLMLKIYAVHRILSEIENRNHVIGIFIDLRGRPNSKICMAKFRIWPPNFLEA